MTHGDSFGFDDGASLRYEGGARKAVAATSPATCTLMPSRNVHSVDGKTVVAIRCGNWREADVADPRSLRFQTYV